MLIEAFSRNISLVWAHHLRITIDNSNIFQITVANQSPNSLVKSKNPIFVTFHLEKSKYFLAFTEENLKLEA
jgi:hypothetical protein